MAEIAPAPSAVTSMPLSVDQFQALLSASGLPAAAQARTCLDKLPNAERPKDGPAFARLLVQQGLLTQFQANMVARGNPQPLVLDDYVILDKLGAGGMGTVFMAEHRRMKRPVALKVMADKALASADAVRRFQREVQAAAQLQHANIVTAFDSREACGRHYLVMELVEGKDLGKVVKEQGPMPVGQALDCIFQAARGLAHAHAKGIIHRDIKPANLLLDKQGTVKILDMGLALQEGVGQADSEATQAGTLLGTLDFMSPEQALDTHQADARSDIYSLGCTLFFLLAGKPPYGGNTVTQKILAHREQPVPSLRAARPDVPLAVDDLVRTLLAKKPQERPASMAALVALVEQCRSGLPAASPNTISIAAPVDSMPSALSATRSSTLALPPRRFPRWLAGAAAALLLLVVVVLLVSQFPFRNWGEGGNGLGRGDKKTPGEEEKKAGEKKNEDKRPFRPLEVEAFKIEPGAALSDLALVANPAKLKGVLSWTVETRHPRTFTDQVLVYSPDGRRLAMGGDDGTIRILDCANNRLHKAFVGAGHQVMQLAWSPDGAYLLAREMNGWLFTWEVATGKMWRSADRYSLFALSAKGDKLAVVKLGRVNDIHILDFQTKKNLRTLGAVFTNPPSALGWSSDDSLLTIADPVGVGHRFKVVDSASGDLLHDVELPQGPVCFSWSGKDAGHLAYQEGERIIVREVENKKKIAELPVKCFSANSFAWTPDGKGLLTATQDGQAGKIELWNVNTRKVEKSRLFPWSNNGMAWCPQRQELGSYSGTIPGGGLRRLSFAGPDQTFPAHHGMAHDIRWFPDDERIFLLANSKLVLLKAATGESLGETIGNGLYLPPIWNPVGTRIATIQQDRVGLFSIQVRDLKNRKNFKERSVAAKDFWQLAWSADGKEIVWAERTGRVSRWNPDTDKTHVTALKNLGRPEIFLPSPDGSRIAVSHWEEKRIEVWDTRSGKRLWEKPLRVGRLNWSADGRYLSWLDYQGTDAGTHLFVWKGETGEVLQAPKEPLGHFSMELWSPDGVHLLLGGSELGIYNLAKNKLTMVVANQPGINSKSLNFFPLAWSPKSNVVCCKTRNSTSDFRAAPSGKLLARMETFLENEVYWLIVSADGHYRVQGVPDIDMVYVVQTAQGQETLSPMEFERRYGWKNDPSKVKLR